MAPETHISRLSFEEMVTLGFNFVSERTPNIRMGSWESHNNLNESEIRNSKVGSSSVVLRQESVLGGLVTEANFNSMDHDLALHLLEFNQKNKRVLVAEGFNVDLVQNGPKKGLVDVQLRKG